jgi:uridylate kinase
LKIVISLGGSVFTSDSGLDVDYIEKFSREISKLSDTHEIFIVAGGGNTARTYIDAGRRLGADEYTLDIIGIWATRLNAMTISTSFGEKRLNHLPERVEEAGSGLGKIFVMGGTVPGHSTDAVSAMLAVQVGADLLINATNVDGVYDKDPKNHPKAIKFDRLSTDELLEIVKTKGYQAGTHTVLDMKAAQIIHEKNIKTIVLDGRRVENIIDSIEGKPGGTLILNP